MGQFALSENEGVTSLNLRTSIVTQPKNGRIPALTPAAVARRDALAATRKGKEFDGPEMRSLTERCILWPSTSRRSCRAATTATCRSSRARAT